MLKDAKVSARIGLLSPPSNVVMEVDFYRSLPADITLHTSHIYRSRQTLSSDALAETAQNAVQTAMTLIQVKPDVVLYGHAASSFAGGLAGDWNIAQSITDAIGCPAITAATATARCLKSTGARRLWYIAPYPPAIAQSGADFLTAHGFEVCAMNGMGIDQVADLRQVPLQTTYDLALRTASQADADALYICGTGIRTHGLVGPLERALKKPVITANLAALWGALDQIGHGHRFVFEESRLLEWQQKARLK